MYNLFTEEPFSRGQGCQIAKIICFKPMGNNTNLKSIITHVFCMWKLFTEKLDFMPCDFLRFQSFFYFKTLI